MPKWHLGVIDIENTRHRLRPHLSRIGQTCGICIIQRRRAIRDNIVRASGQREANLPMPEPTQESGSGGKYAAKMQDITARFLSPQGTKGKAA